MFILKLFLLVCLNGKLYSYHFNKCAINDTSSFSYVLETLNGNVKGECYNVMVNLANGTMISSNVMNWLSIPYAEPPLKENRFKNPIPKINWNNIIDGTKWPKPCTQKFSDNGSEDCLFLNIFVKQDVFLNKNKTLVPILFFIHGGGLVGGQTAQDDYESSTLASYGDIVVVTIQYRVDLFGFLHLSDSEAEGNQGILDQNLALKWVYENAERFGGDRNKITICGESAGAISVSYHLIYENSWPYFRNAIMESGGANIKSVSPLISSYEANKRSRDLLAYLGCNSTIGSSNEILRCGQNIDAKLILSASYSYLRKKLFETEDRSYITGTHFPPIISDKMFKESAEETILKKKFKRCKIISGFNSGEYGSFLINLANLGSDPKKWEQNAKLINSTTFLYVLNELLHYYPKHPILKYQNFINDLTKKYQDIQSNIGYFKTLIKILSDFLFACPSFEIAEAFTKSDLDAYVYLYDYHISSSIYPEFFGAVHTDELAMLFGETISVKKPPIISNNPWSSAYHNYSSNERKFNENFLNYWLNFIKYDDPNYKLSNGLINWNSFKTINKINTNSNDYGQYLVFNSNTIKMKTGFDSYQCSFWNYTTNPYKTNTGNRNGILLPKSLFLFYLIVITLF